ncbi:MAG: hypothetical protein HOO06_03305 [Bdellovibrionaceae bacterium]|jgi:hypothetical protein|nr:hypothetical protein [Pseudobdellovibrionaceae bacterium]
MKYVIRNPVVAGMCEKIEKYDYSVNSLDKLCNNFPLSSHVFQRSIIKENTNLNSWLNTPQESEEYKKSKLAATKTVFQWRNRKNRRAGG